MLRRIFLTLWGHFHRRRSDSLDSRGSGDRWSTLVAIAVKRYRESHDEFPSALQELTPKYFLSPPLDPFSGKQLLYRSNANEFIIYNVGANRVNNHGDLGSGVTGDSSRLDVVISILLVDD